MPEPNWLFDTVVLSNFLLTGAEATLEARYRGRGLITGEVCGELLSGSASHPDRRGIEGLISRRVIKHVGMTARERRHFLELVVFLGKGEASCIACAKERHAIVATDDRVARNQCHLDQIPFTGTIGILKASVSAGQLPLHQADAVLDKMIAAGFYSPVRSLSGIM